jgi:hypothetical protein
MVNYFGFNYKTTYGYVLKKSKGIGLIETLRAII